jgi:hypothetical protein
MWSLYQKGASQLSGLVQITPPTARSGQNSLFTVLIAEHAVNTESPQRACLPLDAFIVEVATHIPPLPPVTRAYLIAAAGQIRAVLGCGASWLP